MDISGEYRIPAPREEVWRALNDPQTLQQAIPGCESLEKVSDTDFNALIVSRVGSIKARFNGKVTLSEVNPPQSYLISGHGQGGAAGAAKGSARVQLEEDGTDTLLRYTAQAEVAGKLASVGSRVIQGVARKTADDFFSNFAQLVGGEPAAQAPVAAEKPAIPLTWWIVGAAIIVGAVAAALFL